MVYISQLLFLLFCSGLNFGLLKKYPADDLRSNLLSEMKAASSVCSMRNDACLPLFLHKPSLVGLQCQDVELSIKLR